MVKLIGACCILLSGTMLGFYQSLLLSRRPREVRQMIQAFQRLETEIIYGFTPFPDALKQAAKSLSAPLAAMFHSAAASMETTNGQTACECWQQAVECHWSSTAMKRGEKDIVHQLGFSLGITDRENQIKHIRLAVSQLQTEEHTAREEQQRFDKMWKSLGFLGAALLVLVMY
jgi:stage III sporulation protein AB